MTILPRCRPGTARSRRRLVERQDGVDRGFDLSADGELRNACDRARVGARHHVRRGDVASGQTAFVRSSYRRGRGRGRDRRGARSRRPVDEVDRGVDAVGVALTYGGRRCPAGCSRSSRRRRAHGGAARRRASRSRSPSHRDGRRAALVPRNLKLRRAVSSVSRTSSADALDRDGLTE
jgi:hypothetical protein